MSFDTLVYLALFAGALFLAMRFGCGSRVTGHAHGDGGSASSGGSAVARVGGPGAQSPANAEVDPVCGMAVERNSAKSAVYEGQTYYFCSQTCREKFEAAPASYAKAASVTSDGAGHRHGCC